MEKRWSSQRGIIRRETSKCKPFPKAQKETRIAATRRQWDGGCSGELTLSSSPGSEMFAGLKVAALKENPPLSPAEKVRKANGIAFRFVASTIAALASGAAAIAAAKTQRRNRGEA